MTNVVCEGGVCRLVDMPGAAADAASSVAESAARIAQGYMSPDQFVAFLNGDAVSTALPTSLLLLPFALVLAGLAMNLTPCVLPMVPVNLIVIGKSWRRGLLYGLGSALAYGALGVAAAVGGLAFGAIQGSPWFNAAVAVVFAGLALALFGFFNVDFSRYRVAVNAKPRSSWAFPLFMGALSAVLAGACVAPVLVSALLLTADLYGRGHVLALGIPFLLGVGMALPWPFLGAGLRVLPKPGAWMKHVNRLFGVAVLAFAAWYAHLAYRGFEGPEGASGDGAASFGAVNATPGTFESHLSVSERPVLVDCWASWCKNCAAMERGTLADPKVREALGKFTVIRLRAEDITALRRLPGFEKVNGLPAFLVFE